MDDRAPVVPPSALVFPPVPQSTNLTSDSGPPRKRQRTEGAELGAVDGDCISTPGLSALVLSDTDSVHSISDPSEEDMPNGKIAAKRDDKYYIDSGDCVIRVGDTLFRVHRFLLARDSSAFQDMFMFSLPSGEGRASSQEGFCDDNPIILFGDTPEDFRELLSMFYALPSELHSYNTASADVPRLLKIASLTNKYHFDTTSSWAISAVYSVTSGAYGSPTHPAADLTRVSSAVLTRILEVALRCGHSRLVDYVVECWSNRILSHNLKPAPAIAVADKHGIRNLRGVAYYVQLMEMGPAFDLATGTAEEDVSLSEDLDEDPSGLHVPLTQVHITRLLSGFYSLVSLWDRLRQSPPKFPRPDGCTYHSHGCLATFQSVWSDAARAERTMRYSSADVVGRLRCMEEMMRADRDLCCALSPMCLREAMGAVKKTIKEVQDGLADRFVDLTLLAADREIISTTQG